MMGGGDGDWDVMSGADPEIMAAMKFPVTLFTRCAPWTRFWWYHSPDLPAHCLPHGSQTYLGFSPLFAGVVGRQGV